MKRIIFCLVSIFLLLTLVGCDKERAYILFNKHPFTQDTITSTGNEFKAGDRIYYLITMPQPVEKKRLYIQIIKIGGGEAQYLGHDIVWGRHVKLSDQQIYYYTDYIVLNEAGVYEMNVYSRDNPTKILTASRFSVKN